MPQLGGLESKVMDVLWDAPSPLSVREVHEVLNDSHESADLAYTTVMTVLDRLAKKRILLRDRDGKAWLYRAAASREQQLVGEMIEALRQPRVDLDSFAAALAAGLTPAERAVLSSKLYDSQFRPDDPSRVAQ
jgi:predicted transcriptional regulator